MAGIDVSRFKTSDWLKIGGALGFLIFGFFDWLSVDYKGAGVSVSSSGGNVFDFFWTGIVPWLLILAVGVLTFLFVQGIAKPGKLPWTLLYLAGSALALLLMLIRFIFNPLDGKDFIEAAGGDVGRGFGLILCTLASIVVFVGALLGFKESGGDLSDLTDVNKLKQSFNTGGSSSGSTPPPPPPPGATPPPPPPPPV